MSDNKVKKESDKPKQIELKRQNIHSDMQIEVLSIIKILTPVSGEARSRHADQFAN